MELVEPELSVVLCDNQVIHELNKAWRGEDKPTDVLSFPLHQFDAPGQFQRGNSPLDPAAFGGIALGDIVISVEYATALAQTREHQRRVAQELGVPATELEWSVEREVYFLLIHGLLHLVGHDHITAQQEQRMKAEERRLWEHAALDSA